MPRLYMVRHGRAASGFGDHKDPGLDTLGRVQAEAVAQRLAPTGPLRILSSPLRRARETAIPLSIMWSREPILEPAVAEIPSPGMSLEQRVPWLQRVMKGTWLELPPGLIKWRQTMIDTLTAQREDTVIFTHFLAINVAIGVATGDDNVIMFAPDNGSVTIFDVEDGRLNLVEKGREAQTKVN